MKLLSATAILVVMSAPAWAIGGYDQAPISTYQAQQQAQAQHQSETQHQSSVNRNANANNVRNNVNVTVTAPATAATPAADPATKTAAAATPAADPAASDPATKSHGGNGWHGGHGGGNTTINAPPALGLALAPSSGTGCGSEGIGAGGAGPAAGGLLSYTWEAPNCTAMQYAAMLDHMGHRLAALYVLNSASDKVHDALEWEARYAPLVPAAPTHDPNFIGEFCAALPQACDGGE